MYSCTFLIFSDGRVLSEPFMKLPSKNKLPDYYDVIKKPLDIKKIHNRIDESKVSNSFCIICLCVEQWTRVLSWITRILPILRLIIVWCFCTFSISSQNNNQRGLISLLQYTDFDELEKDFFQMCKNAQAYNEEASLIHEDSIVLQSVFTNARQRLEAEGDSEEEKGKKEYLGLFHSRCFEATYCMQKNIDA